MTARRSRSSKEISVTNAANAALAAPRGRCLGALTCGIRSFLLLSGEGGQVVSPRLLVLLRRRGGMTERRTYKVVFLAIDCVKASQESHWGILS